MSRTTPFSLALLLSLPIVASAQTYKCKQADGSMSYQDRPCQAGAAGTTISVPASSGSKRSSAEANASSPSYQDQLRDNERRHIAEETKAQSEQMQAFQRAGQCTAARQQLGVLREQRPVYVRDNAGERKYIDDKDRPREIVAAQQRVAEDCR